MNRRLAAIASLLLFVAAVVLAVIVGVERFPGGLTVLACVVVALLAAWWALLHRGAARLLGAAVAGVLLVGAVVLVVLEAKVLENALILVGLVLSVEAARRVFTVHVELPVAPPPKRPVLFYNPKSGGGKAERFHLAREARARGIEPIELHFGEDLVALVGQTIDNGADAVGAAGGDGTQAIVATIAAERGIPYVCVPAGTRNHFALDLGVDRDDVVGALDAFTKGGERIGRPCRGQRPRVRQQRVARRLRRSRPARRLPGRQAADDRRHDADDARLRVARRWTCAGPAPTVATTPPAR